MLNFFSLHRRLRPHFCVGRSSWTPWKVSGSWLGVVV